MSLSTHEVEETHQNKDASPYISDTDSEDEVIQRDNTSIIAASVLLLNR
jgi:hypothetical protein